MKILAIRGQNLASLAGDFEVSLSTPPLSDLGLIPISGPTGAGKSTLLDALCLALFDRTPRLRGRGGARVSYGLESDRDQLLSSDPRSLLRRGAAEGFAEVDFVGRGGRSYRARWSVRRARGRPSGRLQTQQLALSELGSGQPLGGSTKSQVLQATEEALGLDYDAFCRSVLLAQNEFAAFLEARPTERAELLERLTGTELYGQLSVAAHHKASEARRDLERVDDRLRGVARLDEPERATLTERRTAAAAELDAARTQREEAHEATRWHQRQGQLTAAEAAAREQLAVAEAAWLDAAPMRTALEQTQAAQPAREVVASHERARAQHSRAAAARATRNSALEAARAAWQQTERAATEAQAAFVAASERQRTLAPELEQARQLDQVVGQAQAALVQAEARAARAERDATEAEAEWARSRATEAELVQRRKVAEDWLGEHAHLRSTCEQWPRWEVELEGLSDLERRQTELATRREPLAQGERTASSVSKRAQASEQASAKVLEEAQRALAQAKPAQAEAWRDERATVSARRLVLEALTALRDHAARLAEALSSAQTKAAEAAQQVVTKARSLTQIEHDRAQAQALHDEAARALAGTRAARDLTQQRHDLRAGEPCPLCGACEHPFAHELPPLAALEQEQAARVAELEQALSVWQERQANDGQARQQARQLLAESELQIESLGHELGSLHRAWRQQLASSKLSLADDPRAVTPEALDAERATLEQRLEALDALQGDLNGAQARLEEARAQHDHASRQLEQARASQALSAAALAEHDSLVRRDQEQRARHLRALGPILPTPVVVQASLFDAAPESAPDPRRGWRGLAEREPSRLLLQLREQVRDWTARHASLDGLATEQAQHETAAATARTRAEERRTRAAQAFEERDRRRQELERPRESRGALLSGRATGEVEAELALALDAARKAREVGSAAAATAQATLAAARASAEAAEAQLTAAAAAEAEAGRQLEAAAAGLGLSIVELRLHLAREPGWITNTRAELATIDRRRHDAAKAVEIHAAQRALHQAQEAPRLGAAEAPVALAAAKQAAEAAEAAWLESQALLTADARARQDAAELGPQREALRARAELWEGVGELIGSHDGKKLRVFAQSLSLELLLERANQHLLRLAPRYQLRRVGERDLDLEVVDRDLGDEIRAVTGLSGGERFLVSLALALGLASLAARDTQVESLFVDEGLGSLDPESQELALSTLDALQAGGRQVVLISHVPGLAERVGVGVRVVPQARGASEVEVGADFQLAAG